MNSVLEGSFYKLEERKKNLLQKLENIDEELLTRRPGEGQWSVVQVITHLSDSEQGSLAYCMKKINAGKDLPDMNFLNNVKMRLFNLFLYSKIKYKVPSRFKSPDGNINYPEACINWYNTRESWRKFLDVYPDEYMSKAIFKHPVAGRISLESSIWFFEAHLRHHEYQIDRILNKVSLS
ncbi:MAG: hypothetical protein ACJA08_000076 [Cyclobacteriaceae bacterium]|jgi:hypothetical protein